MVTGRQRQKEGGMAEADSWTACSGDIHTCALGRGQASSEPCISIVIRVTQMQKHTASKMDNLTTPHKTQMLLCSVDYRRDISGDPGPSDISLYPSPRAAILLTSNFASSGRLSSDLCVCLPCLNTGSVCWYKTVVYVSPHTRASPEGPSGMGGLPSGPR